MKRRIFCSMALASTAAGRALAQAQARVPSPEHTIGMSFPAATHGWMGAIIKNAADEANARRLKYVMTTADDAAQQAKDVEALIARKVSAVVMLPISTREMGDITQKLQAARIPLILVDRELDSTLYAALVKGDNVGIGTNAARYIGGELKGQGSVIEIVGVPASVTDQRAKGFRDELTRLYPSIRILDSTTGSFQREKSRTAMQDMLDAHRRIDAVFTHDDEMALGVVDAITQSRRKDIRIVTGAGGNKEVYRMIGQGAPLMRATFVYSPLMAKDAVRVASELLEGKPPRSKNITIPASAVHAGNIARFYDPAANY
ncbi:MAG TPA: substrate-binding domain-containing protein [Polaromonas sp.]|uniref:substrate-binding domain-containing protein n=1 Tax=Polaromonas sp. TaxID=1869339 RepID=UPI002D47D466|nr:substrate-binding domain-containing protein [Polaromonas sp.]HYW55527.1 substrate-binding domain-containing protein [Polaromonas sp.]